MKSTLLLVAFLCIAGAVSAQSWSVSLQYTLDSYSDSIVFGVDPAASDGLDSLDEPSYTIPGGQIAFNWYTGYSMEYRAPHDSLVWTIYSGPPAPPPPIPEGMIFHFRWLRELLPEGQFRMHRRSTFGPDPVDINMREVDTASMPMGYLTTITYISPSGPGDMTPPRVVWTNPADGATDVSPTRAFIAYLQDDLSGIDTSSITLTYSYGVAHTADMFITVIDSGCLISVVPRAEWVPDSGCWVTLEARDRVGNPVTYRMHFTPGIPSSVTLYGLVSVPVGYSPYDVTITVDDGSGTPYLGFPDAIGIYHITGIAPGTYTITAGHPAFTEVDTVMMLGSDACWNVRLGAVTFMEHGLEGIFTRAGIPVEGLVTIPALSLSIRTDAAGRYALDDIPPGVWMIDFIDLTSGWVLSRPVPILSDTTYSLDQTNDVQLVTESATFLAELAPNPARERVVMRLPKSHAGNWTIQVTDVTGRAVLRQTVAARDGQVELDLTNVRPGVFLVEGTDGQGNHFSGRGVRLP